MARKFERTRNGNYVISYGSGETKIVGIITKTKGGWRPVLFQQRDDVEVIELTEGRTYRRQKMYERVSVRERPRYKHLFSRTLRLENVRTLKEAKRVVNAEIGAVEVEKTCARTGRKFMESIATPYYCSPSSETYWSM